MRARSLAHEEFAIASVGYGRLGHCDLSSGWLLRGPGSEPAYVWH